MVGMATEIDSLICLIRDDHRRLTQLDPQNDLLSYCKVFDDGIRFRKERWQEAIDKFTSKEGPTKLDLYINYYTALKNAIDSVKERVARV